MKRWCCWWKHRRELSPRDSSRIYSFINVFYYCVGTDSYLFSKIQGHSMRTNTLPFPVAVTYKGSNPWSDRLVMLCVFELGRGPCWLLCILLLPGHGDRGRKGEDCSIVVVGVKSPWLHTCESLHSTMNVGLELPHREQRWISGLLVNLVFGTVCTWGEFVDLERKTRENGAWNHPGSETRALELNQHWLEVKKKAKFVEIKEWVRCAREEWCVGLKYTNRSFSRAHCTFTANCEWVAMTQHQSWSWNRRMALIHPSSIFVASASGVFDSLSYPNCNSTLIDRN